MALNVQAGTITQPGSIGNATINLPASFDPKAILVTSVALAAAGTAANWTIGYGAGTYRGGVVQQRYSTWFHTDASASMNVASREGNEALLGLLIDGGTGALDLELDLVSMSSNSVVVNWANLHTTASIRVNYLVLGGSDITDALVGDFTETIGAANDNVTITAGFGQPDLLCLWGDNNDTGQNATKQWSLPSFGWAKSATERRALATQVTEGNTASLAGAEQGSAAHYGLSNAAGVEDVAGDLDAKANWPTDGFRMAWTNTPAGASVVHYLALKGTFTSTIGSTTSPTGVATQNQDLAHSSPPKGAVLFGWNLGTLSGVRTTDADLIAWGIGFTDTSNENYAGVSEDDAANTSDTNRSFTDAKAYRVLSVTGTTLAEADSSVSGNNLRLAWTTTNATAREFNYVLFGDAPAGASPVKSLAALGVG